MKQSSCQTKRPQLDSAFCCCLGLFWYLKCSENWSEKKNHGSSLFIFVHKNTHNSSNTKGLLNEYKATIVKIIVVWQLLQLIIKPLMDEGLTEDRMIQILSIWTKQVIKKPNCCFFCLRKCKFWISWSKALPVGSHFQPVFVSRMSSFLSERREDELAGREGRCSGFDE